MTRCPDPACAHPTNPEAWQVEEIDERPWDADKVVLYRWVAVCAGCGRRVSAIHADLPGCDPLPVEPACGWCCPLCGHAAMLRGEHRGPVAAGLRCKECRALITIAETWT